MDFGEEIDLPSCSEDTPSPISNKTSTKRKMKSEKPVKLGPSVCAVCYGKATGHHYDVASCNGCKSFFRRVTIEKLSYSCQAGNKCYDSLVPGGFPPKCRACRFKRCVETGMNHLGIQSELKKLKDQEQLEETKVQPPSDENSELVVLPKIQTPKLTIEAQISDLIQDLLYMDLKSIAFRDSAYNPRVFPKLKDCVKEETSKLAIADRVGPMRGWPFDSNSEEEIYKDPKQLPENVKRWIIYDFLVTIELAKTFPFYSKLTENDRFILFRDTVLMATNLSRAYHSYENNFDCLVRPDGLIYYSMKRKTGMSQLLSEELRNKLLHDISRRCLNALLRLKPEKVEFILIRSIVLCNNAVGELSQEAQKLLATERDKYTTALFRYVMTKHGMNGPARFANILNVIDVLEHQQRDQRDMNLCIALIRPKDLKVPILDEIMKIEHVV